MEIESSNCVQVESEFKYDGAYTGPRFEKRKIIFLKGVGIIKSETIYKNGKSDVYTLDDYNIEESDSFLPLKEGNEWIYSIKYWRGPNKINIME